MSIPAGVITVLVSAIPQTTSPVVPGTVSVQVTPSANLIWQTTGQSLATMCTMSPAPGWVVLPAVDQAGFITPDTRQGVTDWSYLITASWQQTDGTRHTENGTIQCFSNQQVEYLSGTTGQLTPAATYPVGGIALNGWVATYSALPTLTAANAGAAYMVQSDGRLYIWSGTAWPASGQGFAATGPAGPTGSVGPAGPANTLSVGSVATGAPLSVTITGTAPNQTINFVLPEGHWWSGTGAPGTISGALNGDFYIDNSGTGNIYQLQSGTWVSQGSLIGPTGARGSNWYTGTGAPGTITGQASGDFYLDTASGNVYKYSGTAWALQGSILGPTGATGTRGSDWFTGSGAPGTVAGAISGDFYLDTGGTGNFYKYNGTAWALQGSLIGPTGTAGVSSTWHVGSGVPAAGLGVNGDMYLNSATGDIYGPKASGAWGAVVENIVGPAAAAATTTSEGIIQLAGVLAGTAAAPAFSASAFGTTSTTAAAGNDSRITGAAPAASPTLTGTITLNGTVGGTGTATAATASTVALRDSNGNLTSVNMLESYATTATAAGTTTLTVSSGGLQYFTGTSTQTVTLPVTSTLALGQGWTIVNLSTGTVTVQSSGANTVVAIPGGSQVTVTCIALTGTTAASWSSTPPYAPLASPALTGTPTAPTPTVGDSSTKVATTGFVASSFAPLASPALTGTPTAPTATAGTSSTQLATTAFVAAATPAATTSVAGLTAYGTSGTTACAGNDARLSNTRTPSANTVPSDFQYVAVSPGTARAVGNGDWTVDMYVGRAFTATSAVFQFETADASGSTAATIRRNGVAVTSANVTVTAANQADGTATETARTATFSQSFSVGDRFGVNITAIGTTPGKGLKVYVVGTWN